MIFLKCDREIKKNRTCYVKGKRALEMLRKPKPAAATAFEGESTGSKGLGTTRHHRVPLLYPIFSLLFYHSRDDDQPSEQLGSLIKLFNRVAFQ